MSKFNEIQVKVKNKLKNYLQKKKYEDVLSYTEMLAELLYEYNQVYIDEELEENLLEVSKEIIDVHGVTESDMTNKVLFYDGFGLDTRGLALIFLEALSKMKYEIVYVTDKRAKGTLNEIEKLAVAEGITIEYIDMSSNYINWANRINDMFLKYKPKDAFFYTTPYDVAAIVAFEAYEGIVKRYQIDLTDHAFWLGKYVFDYCIELRSVGSRISNKYRKIDEKKMKMLPYPVRINRAQKFEGFPFETEGKRIVFSGGSLYKTLGDPENKFYWIVDQLLCQHSDLIYLYAGQGDDSELKKIIEKYPGRAFRVDERKDFFQVMERCVIYLNTYPMFGGMMMHYAAEANKIPITLRHENDADGLLFGQDKLKIEYDTKEELVEDVNRLLTNQKYLEERESLLQNSVISEDKFAFELDKLLKQHTTSYELDLTDIDTIKFRNEYIERFNLKKRICASLMKKNNFRVAKMFPVVFCVSVATIVLEKIKGSVKR